MKDYGQIISKIGSTPWLITQDGFSVLMSILDRHIQGIDITEQELQAVQLKAEQRGNSKGSAKTASGIGVIPIHGPIFGKSNLMTEMSGATSLEKFQSDFRGMVDSADISSIILDIDTPGGTSDLVKEVGAEILSARDTKPIYSIANTQAASAGLWLASQAEKFYVTPSGMVGSLGAYTVHTDQSGEDAQKGLKYTFISAGEHKTEGNPHEPLTAEAKAYRQEVISELYGDFVNAVAVGRNRTPEYVESNFGGGRMMTPHKAVIAGMVDGIRTFDEVVGEIQSQPQQVSVAFDRGGVVSATKLTALLHNGEVIIPARVIDYLESKEWEHSEPGTGPTPRKSEDGSDDKAIKNKWRREIPAEDDRSISPSPLPPNSNLNNDEGGEMETVQEQLYRLLGVTSDEDLLTSITAMYNEQESLRAAVHISSEETRLAKEFPLFYKEHLADKEKNRIRDAKEFASSVTMFTKAEGDTLTETGIGLSALAIDEIEKFHLAFAEGKATLADFESAIKSITSGGTVDYAEHGSGRSKETTRVLDTSTPVGLQSARQQFAHVVSEVVDEWNEDKKYADKDEQEIYALAVTEAAKREPELATAYRQATPGKP